MAISRTQTRFLAAAPEKVWDVLSTPSLWPAFADDVQSFTVVGEEVLVGPGTARQLRLGDKVKVLPSARVRGSIHALTAPPATITALETDAVLEWTQAQPGGGTSQRYELTPQGSGTLLTRRTESTGPLAAAWWASLGGPLSHDLSPVAARIVAMTGSNDPEAASAPLVIIAGGSGYLGSLLACDLLARGRDVRVLTRSPRPGQPFEQLAWDGVTVGPWSAALRDPRGVDIVNVSGHPIGGAGGASEMARMRTSRVNPTRTLVAALNAAGVTAKHWVQGSGVVLRADPEEGPITEATVPTVAGEELAGMTRLVEEWEAAAADAPAERLNYIRTGIVLGHDAAAFRALRAVATLGAGGALAGGKQWVPWIHEDDWLAIARASLGMDPAVNLPNGPVIAAAPHPARNAELMRELRTRVAPAGLGLPTPGPLLRLGTGVLRKDPAVLTGGANATSAVLPAAGFAFRFERLPQALDDILN
ncbi:MAG: DUF1731 domain-containing protein [Arthrobacter sp.]|jgi:uncharacterized protein (TIGR01777 family)|nr:DUF1731 domain-containing protein [Arthrobacter sp.]